MASRWQTASAPRLAPGAGAAIGLWLALGVASSAAATTPAELCAAAWSDGIAEPCKEAVAENLQDLESWSNLARANPVIGADRRALKALRSITIITSDDPQAHFNTGVTAGTLRRFDVALERLGRLDEVIEAKRQAANMGHIGTMEGRVGIDREGLMGEQADPAKAREWLWRGRDAREECC